MTRKKKKKCIASLFVLLSFRSSLGYNLFGHNANSGTFLTMDVYFFFCINSWKWVSLLINFQQKQFLFVFYQTLDLIFRLFSEKVWIYHLKAIILVLLVLQCLMCIIKISHLLKKIYIYLTSWKDSWQNIECLFIATYTLLKWYLVGTTRHYFLLIL